MYHEVVINKQKETLTPTQNNASLRILRIILQAPYLLPCEYSGFYSDTYRGLESWLSHLKRKSNEKNYLNGSN